MNKLFLLFMLITTVSCSKEDNGPALNQQPTPPPIVKNQAVEEESSCSIEEYSQPCVLIDWSLSSFKNEGCSISCKDGLKASCAPGYIKVSIGSSDIHVFCTSKYRVIIKSVCECVK